MSVSAKEKFETTSSSPGGLDAVISSITPEVAFLYRHAIEEAIDRRQFAPPPVSTSEILVAVKQEYPGLSRDHPKMNDIILEFVEGHFEAWQATRVVSGFSQKEKRDL